MSGFYGEDQSYVHHRAFGDLASAAARRLVEELGAAGHTSGTVVDLGCGSGILARALVDAGYDAFGVDISPEMIELARADVPSATFTVGSVHDVAIPSAVGVAAIGEVLNYATDPSAGLDALRALARRVRGALADGGVFVFDVSTPGRLGPSGRRVVFHDHDDWSLGMHAEEGESRLDRRIVLFRRMDDGRYRRTDEHHVLHLYDPDDVPAALRDAGFAVERGASYGPEPSSSTPPEGWAVFVGRA